MNTHQSLPIITTHERKFQLLSNADILQRRSHIPPCDDKNNTEPIEIQCRSIKTYNRCMNDIREYSSGQHDEKCVNNKTERFEI